MVNPEDYWLFLAGIPAGIFITFFSKFLWKKYEERGKYQFTLSKFPENDKLYVRIQNQGRPIEACTILCNDVVCDWWDGSGAKPRNIDPGGGGNVVLPNDNLHLSPLIKVKRYNQKLRKIQLKDIPFATGF